MAGEVTAERKAAVTKATKAWTDQLIDISGNNKLLFYKQLKVGTLDLTLGASGADLGELLRLRSGAQVRLSNLFRDETARLDAAKTIRYASVPPPKACQMPAPIRLPIPMAIALPRLYQVRTPTR